MPEDLKEEKEGSWFKRHEFFLSILSITILLFTILFFANPLSIEKQKTCGDSSFYDSCSTVNPYYCDSSGLLIEKASVCGCSAFSEKNRDSCTTDLQTEPGKITLKYVLHGE